MKVRTSELAVLRAELREPMERIGFLNSEALDFVRSSPFGSETLRFGGRLDESARLQISGTAGLVFGDIERVLRQAGKEGSSLSSTILMPLHLLHPDRQYYEWSMGGVESAPAVASQIMAEVERFALPFFEKYGQITEVKRTLEQDRPPWFVLTPVQRIQVLAAIELVYGSPARALAILDEAIAARADAAPKKRVSLERMRSAIRASVDVTRQEGI